MCVTNHKFLHFHAIPLLQTVHKGQEYHQKPYSSQSDLEHHEQYDLFEITCGNKLDLNKMTVVESSEESTRKMKKAFYPLIAIH